MVEEEEVKQYKNIEMPDALKELEMRDFHFNVQTDGKIEFWLHFDQGILPEEWPELRERKTRAAKTGDVAPEVAPEATEAAMEQEVVPEATEAANTPERAKRGRKPGKRTKADHPRLMQPCNNMRFKKPPLAITRSGGYYHPRTIFSPKAILRQ